MKNPKGAYVTVHLLSRWHACRFNRPSLTSLLLWCARPCLECERKKRDRARQMASRRSHSQAKKQHQEPSESSFPKGHVILQSSSKAAASYSSINKQNSTVWWSSRQCWTRQAFILLVSDPIPGQKTPEKSRGTCPDSARGGMDRSRPSTLGTPWTSSFWHGLQLNDDPNLSPQLTYLPSPTLQDALQLSMDAKPTAHWLRCAPAPPPVPEK